MVTWSCQAGATHRDRSTLPGPDTTHNDNQDSQYRQVSVGFALNGARSVGSRESGRHGSLAGTGNTCKCRLSPSCHDILSLLSSSPDSCVTAISARCDTPPQSCHPSILNHHPSCIPYRLSSSFIANRPSSFASSSSIFTVVPSINPQRAVGRLINSIRPPQSLLTNPLLSNQDLKRNKPH